VGNPLRSEAEAFRFLLFAIGYFALIVIGSLIDTWVGLAVFIVLTAVVIWVVVGQFRKREP
jgi:Flp pilus assembly protein TadB